MRGALTRKSTNPKDACGVAKAPLSTISAPVLMELGLSMLEGARKYGRHNYRIAGVRASVYYDAAMRHLMAWWEGEDIDPESGLPHLIKAMTCLAVVRDSEIHGNWVDDRPPRSPAGWQAALNAKAKAIIARHPAGLEAWTELRVRQRLGRRTATERAGRSTRGSRRVARGSTRPRRGSSPRRASRRARPSPFAAPARARR